MNPAPHGRHARIAQQLAEILGPAARGAGLEPRLSIVNLGTAEDYRVPDGVILRSASDQLYYATAALVMEIVSPDDETWRKLDFYAALGVDELLIVDPEHRRVDWLACTSNGYEPVPRSRLIDLDPTQLAARIDWPPREASTD